jgi:hypothetical protein
MNTSRLWKLLEFCLAGIGHGETVSVAPFPIVNELYNGALLTVNNFNISNFPAYLLVFFYLCVACSICNVLLFIVCLCKLMGGGGGG